MLKKACEMRLLVPGWGAAPWVTENIVMQHSVDNAAQSAVVAECRQRGGVG